MRRSWCIRAPIGARRGRAPGPTPILVLAAWLAWLASAPAPAHAEWVEWIANGSLVFEYTDNLSDSPFQNTEKDDFSWETTALFGRIYQLGDNTRATLGAEVSGEVFHQFADLSRAQAGVRLSLFHKLGLGDAPWVRISGFGGYREVIQDQRSGPLGEVEVMVGKRFTPRLDASFSYLFTARDGGKGPTAPMVMGPGPGLLGADRDVFDQQFHQITLQGSFLALPRVLLTAGYTFFYGEFAAFANCGAGVPAKADVRAVTSDDVFNGCLYRLDGMGHAPFVKASYGLTDHLSLDVGYRFNWLEADRLEYERNTGQLLLQYRY